MSPAAVKDTKQEQLEAKANNRKIIEKLTLLGGQQFTVDDGITYHDDPKDKRIVLPKGMDPATAAQQLMEWAQAQKQMISVERTFDCSPGDGAYCFQLSLKEVFGMAGVGKPIHSFFGTNLPETIEVRTGTTEDDYINAPWGKLSVGALEGHVFLKASANPDLGYVFQVAAEVPKRFEGAVNGLFKIVEQTIKENSIYIGKAFQGVGLDIKTPERNFIDPFRYDAREVVYSERVWDVLRTEILGVIEAADLLQEAKQPINTKHLLYGPYGTGKTLFGAIAGQICLDNGWTFIQCTTGKDDIEQVVRWAKIYARSNKGVMIFVEDIDVLIDSEQGDNRQKMSRMMDLFDGLDSKNNRVMMVMTSNHLELFDAPFTRQGRFDNLIHVEALDKEGVEKLLRVLFKPEELEKNLDFEKIWEAMQGYEPAFIRGTFNRVKRSAIVRTRTLDSPLSTNDFVVAADALREQWTLHQAKKQEKKPDKTVDKQLRELITSQVFSVVEQLQTFSPYSGEYHQTRLVDEDA